MNATTRNKIISLPLNEKERTHSSRDRKGHHVFLSRCFFLNLSPETKIELIYGRNSKGPENPYDDVNSVGLIMYLISTLFVQSPPEMPPRRLPSEPRWFDQNVNCSCSISTDVRPLSREDGSIFRWCHLWRGVFPVLAVGLSFAMTAWSNEN